MSAGLQSCAACDALRLDLAAERARADALLTQLGAVAPGGACPRCAAMAAGLAATLRELAAAREREAELLGSLREWNLAAAAALDGKGGGQ